jgi:16S rRNA (cytosine967-C5)-methyltransferase
LKESVQEIAAEVIRGAGRQRAADAALREALKNRRDLAPWDATAVSRLVFTYYRWHGWLLDERGVDARMRLAQRLDARFQSNPNSFPPAELRARAVPAWTAEQMEMPDPWLRTLQTSPRLWLRAKHGQGRALAGKLGGATPGPLPDALAYAGDADLFQTPEFHAGEFEIQDIASQLVGWLCAPQPGETWWDACAGEGGKTLHLSDLMQNRGLIWASDRAAWRLQKLKRRAARAKAFNYRSALWDGGAKLPTKTKFDGALVDAPCSGVGTWQRNPHARWTTDLNDVEELAALQKQLLTHVAPNVKPGGKLFYSVCTLTRKETSEVAEAFSREHPEFEPLAVTLPAGETPARHSPRFESPNRESAGAPASAPALAVRRSKAGGDAGAPVHGEGSPGLSGSGVNVPSPTPTLTIWPQDWDGNGMFVAAWRRRK